MDIITGFFSSEPKTVQDAKEAAVKANAQALESKTKADEDEKKARDAAQLAARLEKEQGQTTITTTEVADVNNEQDPMYAADSKGGRRRSRKQNGGRRRRTRRGKRSGCKRCGLKQCVCSKKRRTRR